MYFLVLPQQCSPLGLNGTCIASSNGQNRKIYPSCQTNTENQLFQYCPTRKDNTESINFSNWECLYYDSSWDIRWNTWFLWSSLGSDLGISLVLRIYFTVYPNPRHNTDTVKTQLYWAYTGPYKLSRAGPIQENIDQFSKQ